ncbi:DUF4422 domain-containing protein [Clostridiales bacterium TF09-2AC]|nr:DUF4422 domain-containing protein [Clostridiales bacterium TF09-2AC]
MGEKSLNKKEPHINIYVSYHKQSADLRNKYIIPIHVGAAISPLKLDMLRDDSGENISSKNEMYCELTAQFWAWKNVQADYIGFMHYRRHFIFTQESALMNEGKINKCKSINEDYIKINGLEPAKIQKIVANNDIILPLVEDTSPYKNVYEHYCGYDEQHKEDYDLMLEVIQELYPEYYDSAIALSNSNCGYFCNMFIMKQKYFNDYSEWLFTILFEMEKRKDYSNYSTAEYRVLAYLAERLLGIYITYLKKNTVVKILELQHTFVENVDDSKPLKPAFKENNLLIFMSSDNYYVPYLATLLYSIIKNRDNKYNYDLVILTQDITEENQTKLQALKKKLLNVSIRFYNVMDYVKNKKFNTDDYALETYFRLFAPEIFCEYDKGLYLDSDMVVDYDVAELFQMDLTGYYLAAIRDYDEMGHVRKKNDDWNDYLINYVGIKDVYSPFQGGVLLMNLSEFRKNKMTDIMVKKATEKKYRIADQDVLNLCCEGKVLYVNPAWDIMVDNNHKREEIFSYSPRRYYKEYLEAVKEPKIIHFCGYPKPWNIPESDMAEYFWKYAKETPFYEIIIDRLIKNSVESTKSSCMEQGKTYELIDNQGVRLKGVNETIYLDGLMVKTINKINKKFPIGSTRRERIKKIARFWIK